MKIFWNYIFFSTWKVLTALTRIFIEKPIDYLFSLIPCYRNHKNREEIEKINYYIMHGKVVGINIIHAFRVLMLTTFVFLGTLAFYFLYFFNFDFKDDVVFYSSAFFVAILSYFMNEYLMSWSKSGYIEYFEVFEKKRNKLKESCVFLFFHLGTLAFAILSVYFTIFYE
ncbi:hypothetical protein [Glaesserella sp.]|uniref:hypothetical protein n=1 Tax=Glaesserella sp. TaxID=2094731 RepID=UPI00359F5C1C